MPELPEVETIKRELKKNCLNKKIKKVFIYTKKLKFKITKKIRIIEGQTIINIKRYSKYLLIKTSNNYILIHLGMSGNIFLLKKKKKKNKHDHWDIQLKNKIIRYNDIRKFGFIVLYKKKKIKNIISKLGPEPLKKEFNAKYLFKITSKKKICIHNLIMNNKIISGIGNIYANESLFISKIIPYRKSNTLSYKEIKTLVKNIKLILKKSLFYKGTTIRNYKNINNNYGFFQNKLLIYQKSGKKCHICMYTIDKKKKYGRNLYFCKKCQK